MLITCPYCGPRDVAEFTYQGDGNRRRPDPASTDITAWNDYVYDRVNIAGDQNEIWQHSGGCRSHIAVTRNTLTHIISSVRMVRDAAPSPAPRKSARPAAIKSAAAPKAATKTAKAASTRKPGAAK